MDIAEALKCLHDHYAVLFDGIDAKASDIHIEPRLEKYVVRYRVDGILQEVFELPQKADQAIVTRFKVLARMDIAEHRRPQDGTFTLKYNANTEDVTAPTDTVIKYNDAADAKLPGLVRSSYDFLGWSGKAENTLTTDAIYAKDFVAHAKDAQYVFPDDAANEYDLIEATGDSLELFAVWKGKTAHVDKDVSDEVTYGNDTALGNFYPTLKAAIAC